MPERKTIGINGFGRIGRSVFDQIGRSRRLRVLAINETGQAPNVKGVALLSEASAANLPWRNLGVRCVIEATGAVDKLAVSRQHLDAGAKLVIVTAAMGEAERPDASLIYGINHDDFDPSKHRVISALSCTNHCLAPVLAALKAFGVESGEVVVHHGFQGQDDAEFQRTQKEGPAGYLWPYDSGVIRHLLPIMPWLPSGLSSRGYFDQTLRNLLIKVDIRLARTATRREIIESLLKLSYTKPMKRSLYVSADPVNDTHVGEKSYSSVVDLNSLRIRDDRELSLFVWGNNVDGYSARILDLLRHLLNAGAAAPDPGVSQ